MQIDEIDVVILDNETGAQSLPARTGSLDINIRSVLARVTTESGIVGVGESFQHADSIRRGAALARSVEALGEQLIGEDPRQVRGLWHALYDQAKRSSAYEAMSVLDQALWDVIGRDAGVPLYRLLGGQTGDLNTYATYPHMKSKEDLVAAARELAERGFSAMKIVAGLGVDRDRERIRFVAERLPDGFGLAIDSNTSYSYTEAVAVAETASKFGLEWFEEPIAHEDLAGIADLRRRVSVPIAGYQTHTPHYPVVKHLQAGAYDIYQPAVYHCGGITAAMNVATIVEAHNKRLVPHAVGPAVNYAASLHVAAAAPTCDLIEFAVFDGTRDDPGEFIASPYVQNQAALSLRSDGTISPPSDPGIGVTLDETALEASRVEVE